MINNLRTNAISSQIILYIRILNSHYIVISAMKNVLVLCILFIPILITSCENEENEPVPQLIECLETSITYTTGVKYIKHYNSNDQLIKLEQIGIKTGDLLQYYTFDYDTKGFISRFHRVSSSAPNLNGTHITQYDTKGNWIEDRHSYTSGEVFNIIVKAEYDSKNQISTLTWLREKDGVETVTATDIFMWQNGNIISKKSNQGDFRVNDEYEYYEDRENKAKMGAETMVLLSHFGVSDVISYNKNFIKRDSRTVNDLIAGTVSERTREYDYEFDSDGYPTKADIITTVDTNEPTLVTSTYEFTCD
ncbi:hypothetical protein D770_14995 [Flammeovirgaceae bacterium 311]|nr:hypothetical protein D770_14995 [Flammeovirgaceae bacterium 311]